MSHLSTKPSVFLQSYYHQNINQEKTSHWTLIAWLSHLSLPIESLSGYSRFPSVNLPWSNSRDPPHQALWNIHKQTVSQTRSKTHLGKRPPEGFLKAKLSSLPSRSPQYHISAQHYYIGPVTGDHSTYFKMNFKTTISLQLALGLYVFVLSCSGAPIEQGRSDLELIKRTLHEAPKKQYDTQGYHAFPIWGTICLWFSLADNASCTPFVLFYLPITRVFLLVLAFTSGWL